MRSTVTTVEYENFVANVRSAPRYLYFPTFRRLISFLHFVTHRIETDGNNLDIMRIGVVGPVLRNAVPNIRQSMMLPEFYSWLRQSADRKTFFSRFCLLNELQRPCNDSDLQITELNRKHVISDILNHPCDLISSLSGRTRL